MKRWGIAVVAWGLLAIFSHANTPISERYQAWIQRIPKEINITDYLSVVVISEQKHYLFHNGELQAIYPVSTGSKTRYKGDRTMKEGLWRLGRKMDKDLAPIYGVRLIFMEKYNPKTQTYRETNLAFHGTNEPERIGSASSMGCVYHYDRDMLKLYDLLPRHSLILTVNQ